MLIELGGVFARQDGVLSKKAVFECVFRGAGFPLLVRGPVDFFAFSRFALICLSVAMAVVLSQWLSSR